MLLTPCLCASSVLILPTLISLLMRHSFQIIIVFGWRRVPIVELFLFLFCSWSNSFDCFNALSCFMHYLSYLHAFCASCISLYAFFFVLILLLCFSFGWVKNQKPHKKWKIQKVWSYMFEHISHVSLALHLRSNGLVHLWA